MGLISQVIPNLFNGVSQQPASLRNPSQCELQENAYPSIASGLRKRNPTIHRAKLRSSAPAGAFVHMINRDANERYVVVVLNGGLEVYDLNGAPKTVHFPQGAGYLASSDPAKSFSLVTIADYTFVVNKTVTTAMSGAATPANPQNVAYVHVSASPAQHTFVIYCDGKSGSVSLGTEGDTLWGLAGKLASALTTTAAYEDADGTTIPAQPNLGPGYSVSVVASNIVKIVRLDGQPISVSSNDSYSNLALKTISNGVSRYSDLPANFETGFVVRVGRGVESGSADYYVEFKNGGWVEAPKPGVATQFNAATLPHRLVRNSDGSFTFSSIDWGTRKVGDDVSNPAPSFIGRKIRDIFFYRNRLGAVSDENVILSRAGEFFNFWAETAVNVLDSDPVDTSTSHTKVSILNHAIPFNTSLMLFSDQTQFQLTAGDVLTPKTVKVDAVTEFDSSPFCRPVAVGQELFFPVPKEGFTAVREYYVDSTTISNDAADVTAHVPTYIPSGVFRMAATSGEDVVMALTDQDPNAIYVYKFYWAKDEKVQSAWSRFVFPETDKVLSLDFMGNVCYLVIQRPDGVYLESMSLRPYSVDEGFEYEVLLDRRVNLTGVYDADSGFTTWALPYSETGPISVILGNSFTTQGGYLLSTTRPSPTTVRAYGDYSSGPCFVGRNYTMRYRLSEQFVKDEKNVAISGAKVKMKRMRVSYERSGYFRAEVTPKGRETFAYAYTGRILGSNQLLIGKAPIESGAFSFPVLSGTEDLVIELVNDSHLPSNFQSIEWDAEFTIKAQRR